MNRWIRVGRVGGLDKSTSLKILADYLSSTFLDKLAARCAAAAEWNASLPDRVPSWTQRTTWWMRACVNGVTIRHQAGSGNSNTLSARRDALEREWRVHSGKRKGSIAWALNDVMVGFWAGGARYTSMCTFAQRDRSFQGPG